MKQYIDIEGQCFAFQDKLELKYSAKCHPRDIVIIEGDNTAHNRELIALEVRRGQGVPAIGLAKGLLHE